MGSGRGSVAVVLDVLLLRAEYCGNGPFLAYSGTRSLSLLPFCRSHPLFVCALNLWNAPLLAHLDTLYAPGGELGQWGGIGLPMSYSVMDRQPYASCTNSLDFVHILCYMRYPVMNQAMETNRCRYLRKASS